MSIETGSMEGRVGTNPCTTQTRMIVRETVRAVMLSFCGSLGFQ